MENSQTSLLWATCPTDGLSPGRKGFSYIQSESPLIHLMPTERSNSLQVVVKSLQCQLFSGVNKPGSFGLFSEGKGPYPTVPKLTFLRKLSVRALVMLPKAIDGPSTTHLVQRAMI